MDNPSTDTIEHSQVLVDKFTKEYLMSLILLIDSFVANKGWSDELREKLKEGDYNDPE